MHNAKKLRQYANFKQIYSIKTALINKTALLKLKWGQQKQQPTKLIEWNKQKWYRKKRKKWFTPIWLTNNHNTINYLRIGFEFQKKKKCLF